MSFLAIHHLNKQFLSKNVLSDIHFQIEKGIFFSLLGPSGCGKTTLLRLIAGLEFADTGSIVLNGKEITQLPPQNRNCGIVFQNYALFPHLTVYENVAFGLKLLKKKPVEIKTKIESVLEKMGLAKVIHKNVSLLSGGEQQRVSLARVIVTEPELILFDEPLSNLDYALRLEARNELKRLQHELGTTSVYVTHDQSEALSLSDQIAVMNQGKIVQIGSPENVYFAPESLFAANFIGHYNLFDEKQAAQIFQFKLKAGETLAILPEHLDMEKTDKDSDILVKEILFTGILVEYILDYQGVEIKIMRNFQQEKKFQKGDKVNLFAAAAHQKILTK